MRFMGRGCWWCGVELLTLLLRVYEGRHGSRSLAVDAAIVVVVDVVVFVTVLVLYA